MIKTMMTATASLHDQRTTIGQSLGQKSVAAAAGGKKRLDDQRQSSLILSNNSFISAVSEHKDLDLVDLRNKLEKPIF